MYIFISAAARQKKTLYEAVYFPWMDDILVSIPDPGGPKIGTFFVGTGFTRILSLGKIRHSLHALPDLKFCFKQART